MEIFRAKTTLVLMIFLCGSAFSLEFHCPSEIQSKQSLVKPVEGWTQFHYQKEIKLKLQAISITSGPPEENAILVPDGEDKETFWIFSKDDKSTHWVACGYNGAGLNLVRKIPNNIKKCTLKKREQTENQYLDCN